ncbi:WD40-repeat-containing domain protein, partial [Vararia minispora EC-137]
SKKASVKPPKSRPPSTSALSHPPVQDASFTDSTIVSFSDDGCYLAVLSLAVDKHRLRVHDSASGSSVSEYTVEGARVTALEWTRFDASSSQKPSVDQQRKSKKKRKSDTAQPASDASAPSEPVVALGLTDGSILLFSPAHGRVLRTLTHPTSSAAINALDSSRDALGVLSIWSAGADGILRAWDAQTGAHRGAYKTDDRIPTTAICVRPGEDGEELQTHILLAHHRVRLLSASADLVESKDCASFTGHASDVIALQWQPATGAPARHFVSIAQADRHAHLWSVPDTTPGEGVLAASLALDSDARALACAPAHVLVVSNSGRVAVFDIKPPKKKAKVTVTSPRCTISPSTTGYTAPVVAAAFAGEGKIRVARLLSGVKPVVDVVSFLHDDGNYISDLSLPSIDASALATAAPVPSAPTKRFGETTSLAVQSSFAPGQDAEMDDLADLDGTLDVDLAELSLGQRLTVLEPPSASTRKPRTGDSDSGIEDDGEDDDDGEGREETTAITLTRTLVQALHSSDARLLETCLAYTRAPLILQTVRRLPPQLAVPLLTACVERLGRGARGATARGRGGAAGTQRAAGLVRWVKTVLVVHSGHLMTMPDLVARLAGLHATLAARASLQDSLRALSGRLDLILQQMELRTVPAPAPLHKVQDKGRGGERAARRYVEGESEEEDVDIEEGSEPGSVEDVELGWNSDDDEKDEEEDDEEDNDEEDDEEDEEGDDGPAFGGFIDDEAEESEGEESE